MKKAIGLYPCPDIDTAAAQVVSHAWAVLLIETIAATGLGQALSAALARWRPRLAAHDPAKVLLDLAVGLAVGGDCLADIALLRSQPGVFGLVASDPTVSRTIDRLAQDAATVLAAIDTARAAARAQAWRLAGEDAPDHGIDAGTPLIIDIDATLVTAHSDKQGAAPRFKRGYGHHPLWAFVDHGPGRGRGRRWRRCYGRGTRARTPPPTTSRSSAPPCGNSPSIGPGAGSGGRS